MQAVPQLSELAVEQVPQRRGMAVAVISAALVVGSGVLVVDDSCPGPHPTGCGESVVLDPAVSDRQRPSGGSGDRRRPGIGLHPASISEAGAVVAHLGQDPRAGDLAQAGEAGDDGVVMVLLERLKCGLAEALDAGALDVERGEESERLVAEGLFDQWLVVEYRFP